MSFKTEEKIIGDTRYRVRVLPSSKARALLVRLLRVTGPAFSAMSDALKGAKGLDDIDTGSIGHALSSLAANLNESDLEFVISNVMAPQHLEYSSDGAAWPNMTVDVADIHFAGKTDELLKLLGFALEVNFGSFFRAYEDAKSALGRTRNKTASSA